MKLFFALLSRDIKIALRHRSDILVLLLFFVSAGALFPLAIGPRLDLLALISGGIGMSLVTLASLFSMERLFLSDYQDGSLDLLFASHLPLGALALGKAMAHLLTSLIPLVFLLPLLAFFFGVPSEKLWFYPLFAGLAAPGLSLLGAFGAALTLGSSRASMLMIFCILPLFSPFLIFAALGIHAATVGEDCHPMVVLLLALDMIALAILPWATAFALKDAIRS